VTAALLLACPAGLRAQTWTPSVGLEVKESYDDNVLLQDYGHQARRKSWVTTVIPTVGATFQPGASLKAVLTYAPEVARYHAESSENHVAHRWTVNLSGKAGETAWEVPSSLVWIDGSEFGPSFTGAGSVPALGGIPVRDRRNALIFRNGFKAMHPMGRAFIRPLFNSYVHEFKTLQFNPAGYRTGYENYVDRYELSGGFDAGYEAFDKTRLFLGYRVGRQQQSELLGVRSPYSNIYQRALAGAEGTPAEWVKLSLLAGPDFRQFPNGTATGFSARPTLLFYDASITLLPTMGDTVVLSSKRFAQPAFSSHSVYEDVVHDFNWKHKFGDKVTAGYAFRMYGGFWRQPVQRRDYVCTSTISLGVAIRKGLAADLAYVRDWATSAVFNTSGREFKRHLVTGGLRLSL
jgi:hypothetical protein